jgi:hypothetical protein
MSKILTWLFIAMLLLHHADNIQAGEFYQYADDEGNLIFTDDLNKVPQEKQSEMKTFQSIASKPQPPGSEPAESSVPIQSDILSGNPETPQGPEDEPAIEGQPDLKSEEDEPDISEQYSEETEATGSQTAEEAPAEETYTDETPADEQTEYFVGSDIPETDLDELRPSDDKGRTGRFERKMKERAAPRADGKRGD